MGKWCMFLQLQFPLDVFLQHLFAFWMPAHAKYWRIINCMDLIRRSQRRIATSLHLHYHFCRRTAIVAHLQSLTHQLCFNDFIHPLLYLSATLSSIWPSVPHDLSSTSSSFMETLLLVSERVSVHLGPQNDSDLTVCGLHVRGEGL